MEWPEVLKLFVNGVRTSVFMQCIVSCFMPAAICWYDYGRKRVF